MQFECIEFLESERQPKGRAGSLPERTNNRTPQVLELLGVFFFHPPDMNSRKECCQCHELKSDCAPDEGDGGWWCLECIELWEQKHEEHWEDGTPLTRNQAHP